MVEICAVLKPCWISRQETVQTGIRTFTYQIRLSDLTTLVPKSGKHFGVDHLRYAGVFNRIETANARPCIPYNDGHGSRCASESISGARFGLKSTWLSYR